MKEIPASRFRRQKGSRTGASGVLVDKTRTSVRKNGNRTAGDEGEATAHGRGLSKLQDMRLVGDGKSVVESPSPVHVVRTGETQRLEGENKRMPRNA